MHPMLALQLGLLKPYLCRDDIKEIIINRPGEIGLERSDGSWEFHEDSALSMEALLSFASTMAAFNGQEFGDNAPLLSFQLQDAGKSHRVQIVGCQNVESGFAMAIRLQRPISYNLSDFGLTHEVRPFPTLIEKEGTTLEKTLIQAVKSRKSLLISGGTSTGKTSFANILLSHMDINDRIIAIEGVAELQVPQRNFVRLLYSENKTGSSQIEAADLVNVSLRLRPDRILIGELRLENSAIFATRVINSGHAGTIATIHADDPEGALDAITANAMQHSGLGDKAIMGLKEQLRKSIYGVVQLTRQGTERQAHFHRFSRPDKAIHLPVISEMLSLAG